MRNFSLVLLVVYCQQTIYVGGEGGEGGSTSGQEHACTSESAVCREPVRSDSCMCRLYVFLVTTDGVQISFIPNWRYFLVSHALTCTCYDCMSISYYKFRSDDDFSCTLPHHATSSVSPLIVCMFLAPLFSSLGQGLLLREWLSSSLAISLDQWLDPMIMRALPSSAYCSLTTCGSKLSSQAPSSGPPSALSPTFTWYVVIDVLYTHKMY